MIQIFCNPDIRDLVASQLSTLLKEACDLLNGNDERDLSVQITSEGVDAFIPEDEQYGMIDDYPYVIGDKLQGLKADFPGIRIEGSCYIHNYSQEYTRVLLYRCAENDDRLRVEEGFRCIVCGEVYSLSDEILWPAEDDNSTCICSQNCLDSLLDESIYLNEAELQHFVRDDEYAELEEELEEDDELPEDMFETIFTRIAQKHRH